jgi:hypothetical protein
MNNLKYNALMGLTALIAFGMGSCVRSCWKTINTPYVMTEPSKIDYRESARAMVTDYSQVSYGEDLRTKDLNGDGQVDALVSSGVARWIAPEFETNANWNFRRDAKRMSPEIREYVTKLDKDTKEATRLLAEDAYKLQQKESKK